MAFIPPETIEKARQVDLLTYLKTCEPNELVHISGNHYCTREHDSLKISNHKVTKNCKEGYDHNGIDRTDSSRGYL